MLALTENDCNISATSRQNTILLKWGLLQVNGTDVSSFPHEDAVRAFLTAQEPIVVEVKRRITDPSAYEAQSPNQNLVSTGVQTDVAGLPWFEENSLDCLAQDIDLEVIIMFIA